MIAPLTLAMVAALAVEVRIAPDQPLPHVYLDEPVILELRADMPTVATVHVHVTPEGAEPVDLDLGSTSLSGAGPEWFALDGLPLRRGRFDLEVSISTAAEIEHRRLTFWRIERPARVTPVPVSVKGDGLTAAAYPALAACGIRALRYTTNRVPEDPEWLRTLNELHLSLEGSAAVPADPGVLGDATQWLIDAASPGAFAVTANAWAGRGLPGRMGAVVRTPEDAAALLQGPAAEAISLLVWETGEPTRRGIEALHRAAEEAGRENLAIQVRDGRPAGPDGPPPERVIRDLLLARAAGAAHIEVAPEHVLAGGQLGPAYSYFAGLAYRFPYMRHAGELPVAPPVYALVFRRDGLWVLAAWTTGEPTALSLDLDGARDLQMTDPFGNPLDTPPVGADGATALPIGPQPVYLSGRGGSILRQAAAYTVQREAQGFVEAERGRHVPDDLAAVMTALAESGVDAADRLDYFTLLRGFPWLEAQWRAGALDTAQAIPAMAAIARLCRHMAVVEQEDGDAFIEPLHDTLAKCNDYKSEYLTGGAADGSTIARGDWLMHEVDRLMRDARRLDALGRPVEACAVAAMAEWRARALDATANGSP